MVLINLLAWRSELLAYEQQRTRYSLILAVSVSVMTLLLAHICLNYFMHNVDARLLVLNHHITELQHRQLTSSLSDSIIKKDQISTELINTVVGEQSDRQNLRDQAQKIIRALTNESLGDLCLTKLSENKQGVTFIGEVASTSELTRLLLQWKGVTYFSDLRLSQMQYDKNGRLTFEVMGRYA